MFNPMVLLKYLLRQKVDEHKPESKRDSAKPESRREPDEVRYTQAVSANEL